MVGVVHTAKVYGPDVPRALWEARCCWRFGRKTGRDGKAGRILRADVGPVLCVVCDQCEAP